jgi:hypothetical protein
MGKLMDDLFEKLNPTTCGDSPNAIFSQDSPAGDARLGLPDGRTTAKSGRGRRRVSRLASPASAPEPPTIGTYGPTYFDSFVPAGPLCSWENRFRQRLAWVGSTESDLIWKVKDTPHGLPVSRLVPSTRRIDATDFGLLLKPWSTPQAHDKAPGHPERWRKDGTKAGAANLNDEAAMVGLWPTARSSPNENRNTRMAPSHGQTLAGLAGLAGSTAALWSTIRASDGEKGGPNQSFGAGGQPLPAQAAQAWATPAARDYRYPNAKPFAERGGGKKGEQLVNQVAHLAMFPTPTVPNGRRVNPPGTSLTGMTPDGKKKQVDLGQVARALFPTPKVADGRGNAYEAKEGDRRTELRKTAFQISGTTQNGLTAPTEKPGGLNPAFVCWLMGYPKEWLDCAPSTSLRKTSRRESES